MISRKPRLAVGSRCLGPGLPWAGVLLLTCLGGAGLVAAVDRPHTPEQRPELSWAADRAAAPWLEALLVEVEALESDVADLSASARLVLIEVSSAQPSELESRLVTGRAASAGVAAGLDSLRAVREPPPAEVESWRLGEATRERLADIDAILVSAAELPETWRDLSEQALLAAELLAALERHDGSALAALRAGAEGRWTSAVEELEAALLPLDEAAGLRSRLEGQSALLDRLLDGHRRHDEALLALYSHAEQSGSVEDAQGLELRRRVEAARLPLPTPTATLQALVSQTAGRALSQRLSTIEVVRGNILDALDEERATNE
ncbi:hypothetical protein BH24CHL6_BH24CHL6_13770 [soil metagenome]